MDMEGVIVDSLGGGQYRIQVRNDDGSDGPLVRGKLCGRLKKNHIRVLPGDVVTISVSPYDTSHGLITYRGQKRRQIG